ncbi:RNA polymerase sigma factor RpoD, partial [bacterium]
RVSTYAIWWIRQAMLKAIAEQGQAVRIPTYLAQWARKYSRVVHDLTQRYGREPTKEEIAEELGITVHELSNMLQAIQGQISLDRKLGHEEDSKTLGELLEDTSIQAPDYELRIQQLKEEISKLLSLLDEREAKVISLRFGLEDNYPRTLDEIGRIFGLSRERIRQIEARALRKLRKPFKLRELQQYLKEE